MGLFLSLAVAVGVDCTSIERELASYANAQGGRFSITEADISEPDAGVIAETNTGTTILFPGGFFAWDELSANISQSLKKPIFSFHIHDEDLWMFRLFSDGQDIARFNPMPDYWEELSPEDKSAWAGDAPLISSTVPIATAASVEGYFVEWTDDLIDQEELKKAYPDDEYTFGDCWQMLDFMRRYGFVYPLDDDGRVVAGVTYRLHVPARE